MRVLPNLLVISDLHLGECLELRQGTPVSEQDVSPVVAFLDHHTSVREGGRPWRLVINGDLIDFVAIRAMPADAGLVQGLAVDEHTYGLSDGPAAARLKMEFVARTHPEFFQALARFLTAGNSVCIVPGNHDAAFHWPEVQDVFRHAVGSFLPPSERQNPACLGRLQFRLWFFHEPGVAWIEHGHQFDPYCAFEDVLAPDTQRRMLDPNIGGAIMHYIANHYVHAVEAHWGKGFFGYLRFAASQGAGRGLGLVGAYRDLVWSLVRSWWERRPLRVAARRARNRARMDALAKRARVSVRTLLRLRALHVRPLASDLDGALRALMVDRLALLLALPAVALAWGVFSPPPVWGALMASAVLAPLASLSARPREPVDPRAAMRRTAAVIQRLVRVPIVVFGHSHSATVEGEGASLYVNTGSWVGSHDGPSRAGTHLRLIQTADGWKARLCQWREGAVSVLSPT